MVENLLDLCYIGDAKLGDAPRLERPQDGRFVGSFLNPLPFLGAGASYHTNATFRAIGSGLTGQVTIQS